MIDLVPLLTSPAAVVGATGTGKTYTARGPVEQLLDMGRRVVIIDPTGVWWGLRSAPKGADETAGGFSIVIFGGDHADIEITEHDGKAIAEAMAGRQVQAIIDVSDMTGGEKTRFLTDFFETLYAKNKSALHLVVDEADEVCPQNPMPETRRLSGVFDKIVRRGRVKGFRVLMLTQRPAVLHKNVLSQIGTLIALKLTSPQDRKAIEEWVKGNADIEMAKKVVNSLARLDRGEGWVWSPAAGILERQRFPAITTFDSGRTPEDGETLLAPALAWVDIAELTTAMAAARPTTTAATKSNGAGVAVELEAEHQRGYDLGYEAGLIEGIQRGKTIGIGIGIARAGQAIDSLRIPDLLDEPSPAPAPEKEKAPARAEPLPTRDSLRLVAEGVSAPQMRILQSLSVWKRLNQDTPTKVQIALVAGYRPNSGNFTNLLSQLRGAGKIDYPAPGRARLLTGLEPITFEEGRDAMLGVLSGPQRKLFDALRGGEMSKADLGAATGYSANSGNFTNLLSQLRSLGLISYPAPGRAALEPWVFDVL
ncbi:hypothetical protein GCM10007913_12090 [Devosia yakushimensis]|uniref:Helicase HerA central domain-containing protein n=1 Tax=Devosia yakushimensis TaxID=470028 RepID=A0ABQ5UAX8_9HYPH|nr:helicase HerA-like domain-containing protein [Devosia yakushimensis]GLQ09277.1 hypothetical protein GCM10007913_12090 [Devosia yakushimensis]